MSRKNYRKTISKFRAESCCFRLSTNPPYRRAIVQITEECNLNCLHCFVERNSFSKRISTETFQIMIPKLKEARVIRVTLTGGEPFLHPEIIKIVNLLRKNKITVSICTNATQITKEQMKILSSMGGIDINVSLDGFRPESHGKFRGDPSSFKRTIKIIEYLGKYKLLQGIMVTVNKLAQINEYEAICKFAIQNGAHYVRFNPIFPFGKGRKIQKKLGVSNKMMRRIKEVTLPYSNQIEVVYIRFPNDQKLPLAFCEAGNIFYISVNGMVSICDYLFLATKVRKSLYKPEEFIVGNILKDVDIARKLDEYKFPWDSRNNFICKNCPLNFQCGKGCPAIKIALNQPTDPLCPIKRSLKQNK